MKDEYDFSGGKRGSIRPGGGKTRITIYLDDFVLEAFRERAERAGTGYQTLINRALNEYLRQWPEKPLTEATLRRILREEAPVWNVEEASDSDEADSPVDENE